MKAVLNERGSAAMLAAIGMVLLLTIVASFVALAQMETKIGGNHAQEVRAAQAAEAGARRLYRHLADNAPFCATEFSVSDCWLQQSRPYYNGVAVDSAGTATYSVSIFDNSGASAPYAVGADTDNQVVIRSTGTSGRATQTVNLLVQPSDYAPDDALRVNNHLTISGSSLQVQGACASLRVPSPADAAVDIAVSGTNIVVEKGIYTNGTSSPSGTPSYYKIQCAPGTCPPSGSWTMTAITENTFVPAAPTVDPTRYAKYADYLLSGDGYMYQWTSSAVDVGTCSSPCANPSGWTKLTIKDGGGTYTVTPPSCIKGWQFQSGTPNTWTDSGCSATNFVEGTFYIKGKGNLQNNHGTLATPMHVTIITEKALTISGSQSFQWDNLTTTSTPTASINPTAPKDIQFVAGTDVSLTNNLANGGVQGAILAHEQISIAGSSSVINGTLVAEDHCNQNLPVGCGGDNTVLDNTLAGSSIRINYTCGLKPVGLGSTLQVKKWVTQ